MGFVRSLDEDDILRVQAMAKAGLWNYSLATRKLRCSPSVFAILELPYTDYMDFEEGLSYFIPAHQKLVMTHFDRLLKEGESYNLEVIIITPSGHQKWVRTIGTPSFENGKISGAIGFYQDITESKRLDIEGERAKMRLKLSMEATNTAIWEWDVIHNRFFFDDTMYRIFEIERQEPESFDTFKEFLFPDDLNRVTNLIEQCLHSNEECMTTFRIRTHKGHVKHISSRGRVDKSRSEGVWLTVLNWDITQDINQAEFLKIQEAKLIASARLSSLGEMAGGIAHEINNPLAIIQARAESLVKHIEKGDISLPQIAEGLHKIEDTCTRIVKIIKGLRSFSRDSEKDPFTVVQLESVVNDVLSLTLQKFKLNSIDMKVEGLENLSVKGRPAQLGQVFMNLLSNSFDAIKNLSVKWIGITAQKTDKWIEVRVIDSGNGIKGKIQDKMMQPFFTTKDLDKGTGLGLSISKGIIEDHGGRFWYDPKARHTTFVIQLPII